MVTAGTCHFCLCLYVKNNIFIPWSALYSRLNGSTLTDQLSLVTPVSPHFGLNDSWPQGRWWAQTLSLVYAFWQIDALLWVSEFVPDRNAFNGLLRLLHTEHGHSTDYHLEVLIYLYWLAHTLHFPVVSCVVGLHCTTCHSQYGTPD